MLYGAITCVLVGLVWGVTNPFVKRGSVVVAQKKAESRYLTSLSSEWTALLTTPQFLIPQLLNQTASVLFVVLLGGAYITVAVPIVNATCLAANAVVDVLMGEKYQLQYLAPGVALVLTGICLCAS